jgi:hypothetical protein
MKGYLILEKQIIRGEECFIESRSPENAYAVIFQDDGDTAYFYAAQSESGTDQLVILDALHIYQVDDQPAGPCQLGILWSMDWLACALILNDTCHALFDFETRGGYNINAFPPPNQIWTQGERVLDNDLIRIRFD